MATVPQPPKPVQSTPNGQRRKTAHQWLDKLLDDAEAEQIEGRKFYGWVGIEVLFQEGEAKEVHTTKDSRDRGTGRKT